MKNKLPGKRLILLADDDTLIRKYVNKILKDAGYNVLVAANGQEAVSLFNEKLGVDLLILDFMMPKKNGWEAYREINGQKSHIPAIFISGYEENFIHSGKDDLGEVKYVPKPFNRQTILRAIKESLS